MGSGQAVEETIEALSQVANALVQIRQEMSFVLARAYLIEVRFPGDRKEVM